ncbi:MAG: Trk system potassium transporter TrkA [Chthoniobacterales bacterium]
MNITILGAGEIGFYMADKLAAQSHNVTVIEANERVAAEVSETVDARVVHGNGSSVTLLEEARISECDVFLGLSSDDNTNLVAASLAKSLGAKKSISRVHSDVQRDQWLLDFRTHFDVDYLFSSERLAAVELAKHIRNPDCLIVEELARGRIELQQTPIQQNSEAVGKRLRDLGLPPRVRVGSIQRGDQVIIPDGDESLDADDVVTLFGNPRTLQDVVWRFRDGQTSRAETRVVIFGGGEYGFALAQMLEGGRFRTRIIERDAGRCEYLSKVLQRTTLINADATSVQLLKEEQVGDADFFVGATLEDEDNVMTCLQAHDLGVKHCLTLIHRADYADAVMRVGSKLGILGAVSPRVATARELTRFLTDERFNTLVKLNGGIDVIEFVVRAGGKLAGRAVAAVDWPKGSGLISVTHGSHATVPAANDVLEAGDVVVAMIGRDSHKPFSALIS